eukprot:SAG11_NODE_32591_length_282_cov_1.021858_1_plen_39_part_01
MLAAPAYESRVCVFDPAIPRTCAAAAGVSDRYRAVSYSR